MPFIDFVNLSKRKLKLYIGLKDDFFVIIARSRIE